MRIKKAQSITIGIFYGSIIYMTCATCKRNTYKQFIREDNILCYVCRDIYDKAKIKNIKNNV
jgi:hypothetical protein